MAWFRKNSDPLSDRARALNDEIADLEAQIKKLDARLQRDQVESQPRLRSTAIPHGETVGYEMHDPTEPAPIPKSHEPIFEEVHVDRLQDKSEPVTTPMHYNELGVRKYDLPAFLRRLRDQFRGPSTTNPKLVSYLAAGGIQGLRPMRYEKRVARNRFIVLVAVLFLALLGIILLLRHR
jgi:cell division protein FtsB